MSKLFISYRGDERSRVKEVETSLKSNGLCHDLVHDLDLGDIRSDGTENVWKQLKTIMKSCEGMILLIGDTTHTPKIHSKREIEYAKGQNWPILGIRLSNRTGSPGEVKNYKDFLLLKYDFPKIVSEIHNKIQC